MDPLQIQAAHRGKITMRRRGEGLLASLLPRYTV